MRPALHWHLSEDPKDDGDTMYFSNAESVLAFEKGFGNLT
jgi:hypothetical protein